MNEFMKQLAALRSTAGRAASYPIKGAKAAGRMVKGAIDASNARGMADLEAERARNRAMIEQNFGSLGRYQAMQEADPLPPTPGEFLGRLLRIRQGR